METKVIEREQDVDSRLAELGLTRGRLVAAILSGDAGASGSTALHPPGNPGYRRWADTVTGLRMQLLPHGWLHSNAFNYCTVFNPDTRVAIVVMAGDSMTGSRLGVPSSKYPKGDVTAQRLRVNQQQTSLFPDLKSAGEVAEQDCTTWVLVQRSDEIGIHAELSRARSMNNSGYVVDWYERLLLPTIDPRGDDRTEQSPAEPDIDFVVSAR